MWRVLYNSLLVLAAPVVVCILLAKPRCRRGLAERLGVEPSPARLVGGARLAHREDHHEGDKPVIWIHAVSLGEVVAAVPLVRALHRRHPGYRYIVTTVTETGREAVEQRLAGVAEHRYAPLDFPWVVSRLVARWQPVLYLFVETELWPNLLWTLRRQRIPAVLVNGRLSSRSFRRQDVWAIRAFYRTVLRSLRLCLMQTARDAQRIIALGADAAHVHVTGNIKFDQPAPDVRRDTSVRTALGVGAAEQLILAGSTHAGEEEQLVAAYRRIVTTHPTAVLMLAPRHVERVDRVEAMIRDTGLPVCRKTRGPGIAVGPRVLLLDTRGELAQAYGEAHVAFVGGTLVPVGGHNLLEPAVWGKPVLFGPYTDHCAEVAALLERAGGGYRVTGIQDIVRSVEEWLTHRQVRDAAGEAARQVVSENQGALERSLQLIEECLNQVAPATRPSATQVGASVPARP